MTANRGPFRHPVRGSGGEPQNRSVGLLLLAGLAVLSTVPSWAAEAQPVRVPSQVPALVATGSPPTCTTGLDTLQTAAAQPGPVALTVGRHPIGVTLVWAPGFGAAACAPTTTTETAAFAAVLAQRVDDATPGPPGTYNCPPDGGAAVLAYFRYTATTDLDLAVIALTGCSYVAAPRRTPVDAGNVVNVLEAGQPTLYARIIGEHP